MIVTLHSCSLFFPWPPSLLTPFVFCSPGNSCLSKDLGEGAVLPPCYPCRDFQPCLSRFLWPVHCLQVSLIPCWSCLSPPLARSWGLAAPLDRPTPCRRAGAESQGTGRFLPTLIPAPSSLSPHRLCCQKHLSSATASSQGSPRLPSPELLPCSPPGMLWLGAWSPPA